MSINNNKIFNGLPTLGIVIFLVVLQKFQLFADDLPVKVNCVNHICDCSRITDTTTLNIERLINSINEGLITDSILIACCYHQIALEFYSDDNLSSLYYNKKTSEIREIHNDGLLWRTNLNIGINYYDLDEYKQASSFFNKALILPGKKDAYDSLTIFRNLAECYWEIGDFDAAIDFAIQSLQPEVEQVEKNSALNIYSGILIDSKDSLNIVKALELSVKTLNWCQSNQEYENILGALDNVANANSYLGNLNKAIKYYKQAIEHSTLNHTLDTIDKSKLLNNLADSYYDKEDFRLAIKILHKSNTLLFKYYQTEYNYVYSASLENLAENHTALQQFNTALLHYQKALINLTNNFRTENISQNPNPKDTTLFIYSNPDMIRVLHLKATAAYKYYQQNNNIKYLNLANQTYQTAFDFHDKLQKDISTENSRLFQAKNIVPYIENALNVAYQLQENGKPVGEAAFRFMEKNKATVLLQSMNEADALQFANLPDTLLDQEKDLKIALTFHNKQLNEAIEYEEEDEINRLNNLLFEERQQYSQLINNLENNYPNYYCLKYQQNQTHLKEVQQSLDDQTVLLEYFVGDSAIYILSIQKDYSKLYQVNKPDNWKQIIDNFRQSITDIDSNEPKLFVESAYSLYQLLLNQPLCALQDGITQLQIISDAELNYIPFEILLSEEIDKDNIQYKKLPYLLKGKSVGYAYSAALLLENKQTETSAKSFPYGGYAPAYFNKDYNDLPIARQTVQDLANALGGEAYLNQQATSSNFFNNSNSYKILHLSTHGVLNDQNPLSSYLAFSPIDSFKLYAYDLYNMEINSDLSILHACNTGTGELQKGEGVMSLSRAFTYAGCPSLVMSLWQIPEAATSKITQSFIYNLKSGLPKDVALQQAKLSYLNEKPERKASPAYWAGLVATGNLEALNFD